MKKNNFFKILAIIMLVIALLTWLIPSGYYQGEFIDNGISRLGFVDFFQYLILPFFQSMFLEVLVFLLVVGGMYGVLSKVNAYNNALEKIAKKVNKKGNLFLIITAVIIALLSSFGGYGLLMIIFIPAIISIVLLMGYDRITAFLVTFGSMLIGTIGATYASNYIGQTLATLGHSYSTYIYFKIALLVSAFALFIVYTLRHANIRKDKNEDYKDPFLGETEKDKKPLVLYIAFGLLFVLLILGCTSWNEAFGIEAFTKFHQWLMDISIKDFKVFSNILGSAAELGSWSYFQMSITVFVVTAIIARVYKVKLFENLVVGFKKVLKPALLVVFSYGVLILIVNSGIYTTLISYIVGSMKKFNFGALSLSSLITIIGSALHVELPYVSNFFLPYLASIFTADKAHAILNVMTQSLYGLTMFVAPTSLYLLFGLTYLDIPYKRWLKFSWKLVVEILVIILIALIAMLIILK